MDPPASSPIDSNAEQHPGITRRATIGDPVYDNQALVRQRRKATIIACDRCRRRKIRCDGLQPCATCARFGVRCARPEAGRERGGSSAAEHAALADRVRQLEARLAAVTSNDQSFPSPGQNFFEESHGRPELHLDTSFDHPGLQRSFSFNDMTNETPLTDESLSLTVPTIQITGPHGSRPASPAPFSPSPSLFSGTSRASSPDPFSAVSASSFTMDAFGSGMLTPFTQATMRTPPVSQWAEQGEQHSMLHAPESPTGPGWLSRRSSISSFGGLDQGFCAMNLEVPMSPQGDWADQNPFDISAINTEVESTRTTEGIPSKTQAELLGDYAFNNILMPIERTAFKICLEAVYDVTDVMSNVVPTAHMNLSLLTPYSLRMARCLVFLIVAIGSRLRAATANRTTGIDSCYAIAHQQMRALDFWTEMGAQEVAALLATLANSSTQG